MTDHPDRSGRQVPGGAPTDILAPDDTLVERFLLGRCTADEISRIEAWIAENPDAGGALLVLRSRAAEPWNAPVQLDERAARWRLWTRLGLGGEGGKQTGELAGQGGAGKGTRLEDSVGRPVQIGGQKRGSYSGRSLLGNPSVRHIERRILWRTVTYVAAVAVMLFGVLTTTVMHSRNAGRKGQSSHAYGTSAGQRATVTLTDGSRVILGPSTTLKVNYDGSDGGVTAQVVGQALFTVRHHSTAPFTVRTASTVTYVLGTSFLVRQYADDRVARVVVTEGKVSLQNITHRSESIVLVANTVATVTDSGQVSVTPSGKLDEYTGWTTGVLVFRKTPVGEIVTELSRAYGTEIRLADSSLASETMTWTVPLKQVTLSGALDMLTTTLDAHVVRSGEVVTLVRGIVDTSTFRKSPPPLTSEKQYGR